VFRLPLHCENRIHPASLFLTYLQGAPTFVVLYMRLSDELNDSCLLPIDYPLDLSQLWTSQSFTTLLTRHPHSYPFSLEETADEWT